MSINYSIVSKLVISCYLLGNFLIKAVRARVQMGGDNTFNTYIVSILVIFFLQVKHRYPTAGQCLVVTSTESDYIPILYKFYSFYSKNYQPFQHIISTNIGQFQQLQARNIQRSNPDKLRCV